MQKKKLSKDVHSLYNNKLLGHQGSDVTVISDHGNVTIVEDISGERFACMAVDLTNDEVIKNEEPPELKPIQKQVQRKAKSKVAVPFNNQSQLF